MNRPLHTILALLAAGVAATAIAQSPPSRLQGTHASHDAPALELGAVLNGAWQSAPQALSHRDKGLSLGHSDITAEAQIASWLKGKFGAVAHSEHNQIEARIEEAFLEAPGLPGGLQFRAGRFLSQVGYLNENHPHADDFVMRPLLHRALLGEHYYDNGARLNWVLPAAFYWRVGAELMQGKRLPTGYTSGPSGAYTLGTRIGSDLGKSASWQLGWSTLRHRSGASGTAGDVHGYHGGESEAMHRDSHGAVFFGRTLNMIEAVWKWAPDGNARSRQLRLALEHAQASDLGGSSASGDRHSAWYLSAIYRFQPQWEMGVRFDRLRALALHEEGYEAARLDEHSVSLAWKPDHRTTVRLQWTNQIERGGFAEASEIRPGRAVYLQFVRSFGAHGAHAY